METRKRDDLDHAQAVQIPGEFVAAATSLAEGRDLLGRLRSSLVKAVSHINLASSAEVLFMGVASLAFGFALLNPDPNLGITGNEYQTHVGSISLFMNWLRGEAGFPLWNPIVGYGRSLIADPFLFAFNPFVSLPMVLLGLVNGTKVALILNFLMAGLGTWFLARILGFRRPVTIWCGLTYLMSGAIPAHLAAGQIQLVFSLGWLPWSVAGLLWALKRGGTLPLALASVAQALFFFTGNLYHQLYAAFALALLALIFMVNWGKLRLRMEVVRRVLLVAVLSVGLIAIQLAPMIASMKSIRNTGGYVPGEETFTGSQLPEYAFLNYVVSDLAFAKDPVLEKIAIPQESYRYIGLAPLLGLLFVVPAYRPGNRRAIVAFAAAFGFLLAWAGLHHTFVRQLYESLPILYQFRFPGRALSVGALFLIILGGFGLNHLWLRLQEMRRSSPTDSDRQSPDLPHIAATAMLVTLLLILVTSVRRVYVDNRELLYTERIFRPETDLAVDWLVGKNESMLTFDATHTVSDRLVLDSYSLFFRSPSFNEGWLVAAAPYTLGKPNAVPIRPKYRLDWDWEGYSDSAYVQVDKIGELRIWEAVQSYPYAFSLPAERLLMPEQVLPSEVAPVISHRRIGANSIVVNVKAQGREVLVVSEAWFVGWKARIDDQPADLISVSNFLAVEVPPGEHVVTFHYAPAAFTIGLLLSSAALAAVIGMVVYSLRRRTPRGID